MGANPVWGGKRNYPRYLIAVPLSDDERTTFWKRVEEGIAKVGAKIVGGTYDCRWSNDVYSMFFIMEYPDTTAIIAETSELEQWGFFRYVVSETILGTAQEA